MTIPASVLPDSVAWIIKQGSTFVKDFVWTEDDQVTPIGDFTGWTAELQFRDPTNIAATPALVCKTSPSVGQGDITITGAAARFTITISAVLTAALTKKNYIFDLELTNPAGSQPPIIILTPIEGTISVHQNYTQVVGSEVVLS